MAASPAIPGLILCFAAMVLLIFVSVSAPTWNKVSFLTVASNHFGVFGYTDSNVAIGYDFIPDGPGINTSVIHNLTKTLILHPIAAGLAGFAFLFGLCGAGYHRAGTIIMTLLSGLAALVTFVAFVLDMVLFGVTRNKYRNQGINSQYGNANWLTLGALVALLLGFCASACGIFGRYRRRKEGY